MPATWRKPPLIAAVWSWFGKQPVTAAVESMKPVSVIGASEVVPSTTPSNDTR
ncbi:hypothetical protein D3C83_315350 [compost metagenome]